MAYNRGFRNNYSRKLDTKCNKIGRNQKSKKKVRRRYEESLDLTKELLSKDHNSYKEERLYNPIAHQNP